MIRRPLRAAAPLLCAPIALAPLLAPSPALADATVPVKKAQQPPHPQPPPDRRQLPRPPGGMARARLPGSFARLEIHPHAPGEPCFTSDKEPA